MKRDCLTAAGLACLVLGCLVAGDDASAPARLAFAQERGVAVRDSRATPRPTQVWWTERPGDFLVCESGLLRITEFDSWKRKFNRTVSFKGNPPLADWTCPAPNGEWSVRIDARAPVVRFFGGDFRQTGNRPPRPVNVPDFVGIDPNPQALAVSADSKRVLVACDATGPGDRRVAIIDVETGKVNYRPIRGSSNLRGIAVDPTGEFALAVHLLPKSHLPSTQIEQGWVFTNAITWLSLDGPEITVTLPLDLRTQGFANPEGVTIAPDGERAWVAHAGADVVSVIDLKALREVVVEAVQKDGGSRDSPAATSHIVDDFRVTRRYVRARIPVGANPRAIAVSPDGTQVVVANRLDDSVSLIDTALDSVTDTISLLRPGERPPEGEDALHREGEKLFHTARLSFSGQFSCASCHPDGHADGLNWDLPADGFNNFFNTKSLLGNAFTNPYGWAGMSLTLRDRFTGTLRHLFQHEPNEGQAEPLETYLVQLRFPDPIGPPAEETKAVAARGKLLFEGKAGCRACHSGAKFTDRNRHDVGTGSDGQTEFDTPTLLRISTTAPFLHDGRAATLEEIFSKHNPTGLHGHAADLAPAELADLVAYLNSL